MAQKLGFVVLLLGDCAGHSLLRCCYRCTPSLVHVKVSVCTCLHSGHSHVDATSEFAVVVKYQLGQHLLLMAAEVDAVKDEGDGPVNGKPYVELKTYK